MARTVKIKGKKVSFRPRGKGKTLHATVMLPSKKTAKSCSVELSEVRERLIAGMRKGSRPE
jgi:hypothetical protein